MFVYPWFRLPIENALHASAIATTHRDNISTSPATIGRVALEPLRQKKMVEDITFLNAKTNVEPPGEGRIPMRKDETLRAERERNYCPNRRWRAWKARTARRKSTLRSAGQSASVK